MTIQAEIINQLKALEAFSQEGGCYVLHLDLKKGKIWIEQNMTEMRIAQELVDLGVAKENIVLGFQAPEMREYTDYAAV